MSRRLLLLLLVPALVGTMVGVGIAARGPVKPSAADATGEAPTEAPPFELGFSREPSGLGSLDVPKIKPRKKRQKPAETAPVVDIAKVQRRLTELRYYVGPVDGEAGGATTSAVMAFQKVNGLSADGAVGPQTLAALAKPVPPKLQGGAANRIEVDLTKQVLYFVSSGSLERILPVSSGSGQAYTTSSGGTARSLTPVGSYAVQRKISGIREADLGSLYDPMYFYQGWAIHGSNSVPAYPASHGCVRVTRADALWLFPKVPAGFQVLLYGGTHTFPAGSSAPGTSDPAGDTATDAAPPADDDPAPAPAPEPEPKKPAAEPAPKPKPSPEPSPEPEPAPKPSPKPKPSPTPAPTKPAEVPSP